MPEYAHLGYEVFEREAELLDQEYRLYSYIVFHSYIENGTRICRKSIKVICKIYDLDYYNTARRIKRMETCEFTESEKPKNLKEMKTPWLKRTKEGLLPLVGFKNVNKKEIEQTAAVSVAENSNGHKSQFSKEEIRTYVDRCKARGQNIYFPSRLVEKLYISGTADSSIMAELYPEKSTELEYVADAEGVQKLDKKGREKALEFLLDVISDEFEIDDYQKFYTEEDWQWLSQQLNKQTANK